MPVAERQQVRVPALDGPGMDVVNDAAGGGEVALPAPHVGHDQLSSVVEIRAAEAAGVGLQVTHPKDHDGRVMVEARLLLDRLDRRRQAILIPFRRLGLSQHGGNVGQSARFMTFEGCE
ncbi:hypothetical protein Q0Z83_049160 [Actinoplanes sichuanensis]|nr:hypothetical protein Q0Z83_049160 [Actinoplanes sichuanensis]